MINLVINLVQFQRKGQQAFFDYCNICRRKQPEHINEVHENCFSYKRPIESIPITFKWDQTTVKLIFRYYSIILKVLIVFIKYQVWVLLHL